MHTNQKGRRKERRIEKEGRCEKDRGGEGERFIVQKRGSKREERVRDEKGP